MKIAYLSSRPLGEKILRFLLAEQKKKGKGYVDIVCLVTLAEGESAPPGIERWWKGSLRPLAKAQKIPIVPIEKVPIFKPDIIMSVYFYDIIPKKIIDAAPKGVTNLHPGYLPNARHWNKRITQAYRGTGVLSWAILNDEKWQAVTFHYITEKIDLGPVIDYAWNRIGPEATVWNLQQATEKKAFALFKKWLPKIVATKGKVKAIPAGTGKYPYFFNAKLLPLKKIDLSWPPDQIDRTIRAFDFPGREPAYFESKKNGRLKKIYLHTRDLKDKAALQRLRVRKHWQDKAVKFRAKPQATIRDTEFRKLNTFVVSKYLDKSDTVLDIACGNGYATAEYAKKAKVTVGIDYTPAFIDIANKKYRRAIKNGKLKFQVDNILQLNIKGQFDKVICERTLNNMVNWNDQKKAILNLHSALKPKGKLLLVEPTVQGHQSVDKIRAAFGIPPLTKYRSNFYLDEKKFEKFVKPYFTVEEKKHFGTYQLISKILYPLYVYPKGQTFRSKFNKLARLISQEYLGEEGISHTVLYVMGKK